MTTQNFGTYDWFQAKYTEHITTNPPPDPSFSGGNNDDEEGGRGGGAGVSGASPSESQRLNPSSSKPSSSRRTIDSEDEDRAARELLGRLENARAMDAAAANGHSWCRRAFTSRSNRAALVVLSAVLIGLVFVAMGMTLTKLNQPTKYDDTSDGAGEGNASSPSSNSDNNGDGKKQTLGQGLQVPSNLSMICSEINVSNAAGGRDDCEDLCDPASCCHDTRPGRNCYEDLMGLCASYSPCKILLQDGQYWPTPEDSLIPDDDEIMDQRIDPSMTFEEDKLPPKTIAEIVNGACLDDTNDEPHATDQCREACAPSACCFVHPDHHQYCAQEAWCSEYDSCLVLYQSSWTDADGGSGSLIEDDGEPVDVNAACDPSHTETQTDGLNLCRSMCKPTECCFYDEPLSCRKGETNIAWCTHHEVCRDVILQQEQEAIVDYFCSESSLATEQGRALCKQTCNRRLCCLHDDGDERSCRRGKEVWCEEYQEACQPVKDELIAVADAAVANKEEDGVILPMGEGEIINQMCDPDVISSDIDLRMECLEKCDTRSCCFDDDGDDTDCRGEFPNWCAEYKICQDVINGKGSATATAASGDGDGTSASTMSINSMCARNVISHDSDAYMECLEECSRRSCCFDKTTGEDDCRDDNPDWCAEYDVCRDFMSGNGFDFAPVTKAEEEEGGRENGDVSDVHEINKTCSDSLISTSADLYMECLEECDKRSCCFATDNTNCREDKPDKWCSDYSICANLLPLPGDGDAGENSPSLSSAVMEANRVDDVPASSSSSSVTDVNAICAPDLIANDSDLFMECLEACDERSCCFDTEDECSDEVSSWCGESEICKTVSTSVASASSDNSGADSPSPWEEDLSSDINALVLCSPDKVDSDDGLEACEEYCVERACCWYTGSRNCRKDNLAWCEEYDACDVVMETQFRSGHRLESQLQKEHLHDRPPEE